VLFAFGISVAGNVAVVLEACSTAKRDARGYVIWGTKIFTTLSPAWTRLGVHARCANDLGDAHLVFGFVRRDGGEVAEGRIEHPGTWNPLGMRATQSWTTRLEGVRVSEADIAATIEPFDGSDPLILAIFSSFSILTAAVYAGIADRALELAGEAANRPVFAPEGRTGHRLDDPDTAARLTAAILEHRASLDALTILARDVDAGRAREDWFLALAAARNLVTDEARRAVDTAMRIVGASGFQADSELARLYRDVLAGLFHPSSSRALARQVRGSLLDDPV
jgi:alkylation response protein AidB-like acyl-CoA dehydrogenase